jgi:hypothetical protein
MKYRVCAIVCIDVEAESEPKAGGSQESHPASRQGL